jgi:DNA primase
VLRCTASAALTFEAAVRCQATPQRAVIKASSSIIEKNAWVCHSGSCVASRGGRSGGNVFDFVAALERCSIRDAALILQDWFAVGATPAPRAQIVSSAEGTDASAPKVVDENKPLAFTLRNIDLGYPYLAERGVAWETANHFGVGLYSGKGFMEGRMVIPIHNEDGILVAYAGRSLGQSGPKYKFPARFRKSHVLFNLHRAIRHGNTAVVVEGFFDCFNLHQAGFPCVVGLMGCALSQRQEALLQKHFREVILMLDGDTPGRHAGAMIAARLVTKLSVRVVEVPTGTQPDQLSADQIRCMCDPDFF